MTNGRRMRCWKQADGRDPVQYPVCLTRQSLEKENGVTVTTGQGTEVMAAKSFTAFLTLNIPPATELMSSIRRETKRFRYKTKT